MTSSNYSSSSASPPEWAVYIGPLASGCCGQPLIPHWAQQEQPHSHRNTTQRDPEPARPGFTDAPTQPPVLLPKPHRAPSVMFSVQPSPLSSGGSRQFGFPARLRENHLIHRRLQCKEAGLRANSSTTCCFPRCFSSAWGLRHNERTQSPVPPLRSGEACLFTHRQPGSAVQSPGACTGSF